jgi:hypothetical protein
MPDSLTAPVHRLLASGIGVENAIVELQKMGFTPEQAVLAIHRATTLPLADAERRVKQSTKPSPAA